MMMRMIRRGAFFLIGQACPFLPHKEFETVQFSSCVPCAVARISPLVGFLSLSLSLHFPLPLYLQPPPTASFSHPIRDSGSLLIRPISQGRSTKRHAFAARSPLLDSAFPRPPLIFSLPLLNFNFYLTTCITTLLLFLASLAEPTWAPALSSAPAATFGIVGSFQFFLLACRCPFPFLNTPDLQHIQYSSKTVTLAT
jgi:hypothetical protein